MDENKNREKKGNSIFIDNIATLISPEGMQKYILGMKKDGTPRAVYDVLKDCTNGKKKKKKKKGKKNKNKKVELPAYDFYIRANSSGSKKKKKKNKDKDKHWHI